MVLGSARGAVAIAGGRQVSAAEEPELHRMVARLCQLEDRPMPRLVIIEAAEPNAFAAGWHGGGTVAVTRGLLNLLGPQELEAVLAHELGHLANRDAALM